MSDPEMHVVIRGGLVVDGRGREPFTADVGIRDGIIAQVGQVTARGREEIDAKGAIVTPGFIDVHTHFDGHVTWQDRLSPASAHGITTAVIGNCGVGFAPCRPQDREKVIWLMEGVEDIPGEVLSAGLSWDWETYPQYLDVLSKRSFDMDVAGLLPHSTLRTYVMGQRGVDGEPATADDMAAMRKATEQAMRAGAIGFATSRLRQQKTVDGHHIPSLNASEEELTQIALGMADAGHGVIQIAFDFNEFPGAIDEFKMLRRVVEASGRPATFSLKQSNHILDGWRELMDLCDAANAAGAKMSPQVLGRPTGAMMGLDTSVNPYVKSPTYRSIAHLPLADRAAEMRRSETREAILGELAAGAKRRLVRGATNAYVFPLNDPPDYEPDPDRSIEAQARREGRSEDEVIYDALTSEGGQALLLFTAGNYAQFNLDAQFAMLTNPQTVPGLGDGGAHCGSVCDASATTHLIAYWTRDRTRGPRMSLPLAVSRLTSKAAEVLGLKDRGVIAPGYKADINVIDYDRLQLRRPTVAYDLPAGGKRLDQLAQGYRATLVSGVVVRRDDQPTPNLAGRVVRGGQEAPVPA